MKVICRMLAKINLSHSAAAEKKLWSRFLLLLFVLGMLPTIARLGFAQTPLNLANNFFVTGDYVVAGAYNMTTSFQTIGGVSYAVGTIKVPDANSKGVANPGIQGPTQVPKGAQVVAALLYWQAVEKVGAGGSGQNGFFKPVFSGGPTGPGYPISGTNISGSTTVSWSSGGCSGGSTGKMLRTYRADVAGGLPVDASGNSIANGTFEVRIPSSGNATPLALGATLLIIYRLPAGIGGPNTPLNAIVIYDGDYSQSNSALTMTQPLHVYDADHSSITRLTHIVGGGQSNKFQAVYLFNGTNPPNPLNPLPSLYSNGKLPQFPGYYGTWDNPTWLFNAGSSPISDDSGLATTKVVPSMSNQGCVSWGAVIVSTGVKNSDADGILDTWKDNQGYCDYLTNSSCTGSQDTGWIPLLGAARHQKDIFLQYDYMCSKVTGSNSCATSSVQASLSATSAASGANTTYTGTFSPTIPAGTLVTIGGFKSAANNGQFFVVSGTSTQLVVKNPNAVAENAVAENVSPLPSATYGDYSFDPRLGIDPLDNNKDAVQKVVDAFTNQKSNSKEFVLHAEVGNAIAESQSTCADTDTDPNTKLLTCTFPNEPGTVGFREGLAYIKNQTINPQTGVLGCVPTGANDPNCVAVFHHGKKDSYHYALFSHGVGLPNWFLSDNSLQPVTQSGTTVIFTTSSPHGLMPIPGDSVCSTTKGFIGRVTVINAITNPNINGTFCAKAVGNLGNQFSITVPVLSPGTPGTVLPSYSKTTDPNLSVANGQVTSMSGYSDVGGQNSVIALGEGGWAPAQNLNPPSEGNKWNVKAGTFMHEFGHTLYLTHGGTFYNNLPNNPNDYTPTYEVNCKPNVQTVMSYVFQFDLLPAPGGQLNQAPRKVLDYSEDPQAPDTIPTLTESSPQSPQSHVLDALFYPYTSWFQLSNGPLPSNHCDGSPTVAGENSYIYTSQPTDNFGWSAAAEDINFNGIFPTVKNPTGDVMHPHNEWEGTPAAADGSVGLSPGVDLQQVSVAGTISTIGPGGEAGGFKPAGGGGGFKPAGGGGGLQPAGGGGGFKPAGGGGGFKPAGGGGASAEITHDQANSYPRPPQNLFIQQEEASPRLIDLSWFAASFGTAVQYNIYRSDAGGPFMNKGNVPGSQTTFTDTVTCNLGGYSYRVTAVITNDSGTQLESSPSNTVPAAGEPALTGCYTDPSPSPLLTVQPTGVQGSVIPITWTLTDDYYINSGDLWANAVTTNPVNRAAANTLVAIGPASTDGCNTVTPNARTTVLMNGNVTAGGRSTLPLPITGGQFTFNLDTDVAPFCAGSYTFELDLDSGQKFTSSALVLSIDVNDNNAPRITTPALPAGTVGVAYNPPALTEDGGTPPVTWSVTGLPSGISQQPAGSANLSGTACVAGSYPVNATVTDKATPQNSGSQGFTLQINKGSTTTSVASNANPSVFQQLVTFTVTVASAPASSCTPTGTVTLYIDGVKFGSPQALTNGTATFSTANLSVNTPVMPTHSITATYSGDANFNPSNNNSAPWSQTVNKASTSLTFNNVSPPTAFVNQPITVFYTFGVVAPGAGSPIAPTGSITVTATDNANPTPHNSSCMPQAPTSGMCILSPAPTTPGTYSLTIAYSGDGNFLASGNNGGNYTVYQLVFTTQPSNTGVGLTMTPAVQVTAEDSGGTTLGTFTGGVTVAIGVGPGTLSGTTTQNAVAGVATFGDLNINKIANGYTLVASPTGGVPDATSNAFNIDTFYVDSQGNFGTLDLASGTATQTAAKTVPGSTGIDLTPGLQVYAYNTSNQLMLITPSTGAASSVGSPGTIPNQATTGALTNGSYFGIDAVTGILYSIDLNTGATTQVGPTSAAVLPAGCTLDSSLTGSASVLYYTIGYSGASCNSPMPDTLYQINPADGTAATASVQLTINSGTGNAFVGSAFVGGTLYGFTSNGKEYSIDPASGVATLVSSTSAAAPIIAAGSSQ